MPSNMEKSSENNPLCCSDFDTKIDFNNTSSKGSTMGYFSGQTFSRLLAMFLGRKGRLWWRNLPEAEKTDLRNHLKRNRGLIAGSSIAFAIFLGSFGYGSVSRFDFYYPF